MTDAIIIGSGINSLVAAAHMQNKGWSVAIYEAADRPGGAVKTLELTEPGFKHDWAAMNLSLFAGSAFHQANAETLAGHGLEFAPVAKPFATAFPDGSWLGVTNDAEANATRIAQVSGADSAVWRSLTDDFGTRAEAIFAILGSPMGSGSLGGLFWKLLRKLKPAGVSDLGRFLLMSPRAWLDETFESDKVKAMLGAWGMHLDFAPDVAGGALFPYLEGMAGQAFGMALGKGGAGGVTDALVSLIQSRGGEIHCKARVAAVIHQKGKAKGIRLDSGQEVMARKVVIANVSPSGLARLTGSTGDARFDSKLAKFAHAPGTMMIHVALDEALDWTAGEELKQFAYIHLAPSLDQMARTYAQAKAGLLPDEPVIVVGQPTAVDPSRAPDGKHVLWLQVRMVPGEIKGDAAGTISETDWAIVAGPMAERAFDIIERYAPGLRDKVIARRVVTPAELEADNANLVGGDQVCGSHHLTQHFLFRPMRGHADGSTPIKNLHLTGAAVWPGGGTGAGPGYMLAQKLAGK
ncbi:MAG: phytoene desaturase family protein [Paracoccaceae bacterium]